MSLAYDGERLMAAMPYHYVRRMGQTFIIPPQLTQFSGPIYFYPDGLSYSHRLDFENRAANQLLRPIEALRPAAFVQNFSPAITNWLPFYWRGFGQTTRYTYRLEDISDSERLFAAFDREKRQRKIEKYLKTTSARFDMSPADFAQLHQRYWRMRGQRDLLDASLVEHVATTAIARGQGLISSIEDADGRTLYASLVVYDERCAYSLMSAAAPELQRSGHHETLVWQTLLHLQGLTRAFDFEGSMDEGIEYFYRSFGARQTPFFQIAKYRNCLVKKIVKRGK